jgi:hypothetical protein
VPRDFCGPFFLADSQGGTMAASKRRGRAVCITLEHEAVDILHALSQNDRSHGKLVSLLIRQEEQRRIEARKWREKLYVVVEDVLAAP